MSHFNVAVFMNDTENLESKLNEILAPFDEQPELDYYLEFEPDDDGDFDETTGQCGYWFNPNAKWDWWEIGGRWKNKLRLKDGTAADFAKVRDVDFTPSSKAYEHAIRFWEINVEGKPKAEDDTDEYFNLWKPEYYTERYASKEQYALYQSAFRTHAFVDEYGEWYEEGEMGWFGLDSGTQESRTAYDQEFERYLAEAAEKNLCIVIVDCHI